MLLNSTLLIIPCLGYTQCLFPLTLRLRFSFAHLRVGRALISSFVLLAVFLFPFPMALQNHRHSLQADFSVVSVASKFVGRFYYSIFILTVSSCSCSRMRFGAWGFGLVWGVCVWGVRYVSAGHSRRGFSHSFCRQCHLICFP